MAAASWSRGDQSYRTREAIAEVAVAEAEAKVTESAAEGGKAAAAGEAAAE